MLRTTGSLRSTQRKTNGQGGFLLLEALIAILIFSLGLVTLMGLQSISIQNGIYGKYRTDASYLANEIVAQMMADKNNFANYQDGAGTSSPFRTAWISEVGAKLPAGDGSITISGSAVTVKVTWKAPGDTETHSYQTVAQVVF